ncbi:MAG: hypothetical protein ACI9E1_000204 [Cryomorphaceae bacterium]|jgi:hypothetical protein
MNFKQAITRYKRTWVIGQCLKTLLLLVAIFIAVLILYGLTDAVWPLSNGVRSVVNKLILVIALLAASLVIYRVIKITKTDLAASADTAINNKSKTIRAAYDLSEREASSPLNNYLSTRAQEDAVKVIGDISWKQKIPCKGISVALLAILLAAGIGYGIRAFHPAAYDNVVQRLKHPDRDIPPYSPLKFNVTQESTDTVYGADNQVRVEITGGELKEDVICRVRNSRTGEEDTISTFQESSMVFSKKFTNILTDLEYSFSTGRARSEWQTIKVLLQPKFTNAVIKITPPAYTKKKQVEFPLEGNEINIINGSTVELIITSNRPLSGGELVLKSEALSEDNEISVIGKTDTLDEKQVTFKWVATNTSKVSCKIRDLRSTLSAASLEFDLLTRADMAPVADLTSPARYILATPSSIIPLEGNVEDDFEVDSVYLVRTLVGFRDRANELATSVSTDIYNFEKELNLKSLGVEAEQVLEFYLEANDKNPSLLGIATSDVVRVQIISEEDYAERLRNASDWREFNARYSVIRQAIQEAVDSLKKLGEVNKMNQVKAFLSERDIAKKVHERSREIALTIGEDFNAYAMEVELTEIALQIADKLLNNYDQLTGLKAENRQDENDAEIREMLDRLGSSLDEIKKLEQDAEQIQKWAAVAEQAAIYMKLFRNQLSISERIAKIAKEIQMGQKRNAPQITALGQTQKKNKKLLLQFAEELKKAAADLPQQEAALQGDCEVWLNAFNELNIPNPMDATTAATEVGKSHDAATNAYLAHALMKELIEMENNEFAAMLRNEIDVKPEDDKKEQTKKELLDALHKQNQGEGGKGKGKGKGGRAGGGQAPGAGKGQGGGQLMRNQNTPMFGPKRSRFGNNKGGAGKGKGDGSGSGRGNGNKPKVSENNSIQANENRDSNSSQTHRTNIPGKYKEAVKRFYSDEQN